MITVFLQLLYITADFKLLLEQSTVIMAFIILPLSKPDLFILVSDDIKTLPFLHSTFSSSEHE